MTRVLIIGSSHVGAYKNALAPFNQIHGDVTVDFFGTRAPFFYAGQMDENGVFVPGCRTDEDRDFVIQTNGADRVDTRGYDHLVMLGMRFGMQDITALLEQHDVLEHAPTGLSRVISSAFLHDAMHALVDKSVATAVKMVAPVAQPVTFIMAPDPASSIVERRKSYEYARRLEAFWARKEAAQIVSTWLDLVDAGLRAQGHRLMRQPPALNSGPFATKPVYAQRAAQLDAAKTQKPDHRHMNADYGLAMLRTLVETHLTSTIPDTSQREDA